MSDIFAAMPDLSEAQAAWIIAGLAIGLWLIISAGFAAEHVRHNRTNGRGSE